MRWHRRGRAICINLNSFSIGVTRAVECVPEVNAGDPEGDFDEKSSRLMLMRGRARLSSGRWFRFLVHPRPAPVLKDSCHPLASGYKSSPVAAKTESPGVRKVCGAQKRPLILPTVIRYVSVSLHE